MNLSSYELGCISAIRENIEKNYREHLTISQLALQCGINESKLKAGFKLVYGISIYAFRKNIRMEKAKILLEETDKPVKEIAWLTGYKRLNAFIKSFRQVHNCSPSTWRKRVISFLLYWFWQLIM